MIGTQIRKVRRKQRFGVYEYAQRTWKRKIGTGRVDRGITQSSIEKNHPITASLQFPLFTLFLNGIDYRRELVTKNNRMVLPASDSDYSDGTQLYCLSASFIDLCSSPILGRCVSA